MDRIVFKSRYPDHRFLSNFDDSPLDVEYQIEKSGRPKTEVVPTLEHSYTHVKCTFAGRPDLAEKCRQAPTPLEAKQTARDTFPRVSHGGRSKRQDAWEQLAPLVMLGLLWQKFAGHAQLSIQLLSTGTALLLEEGVGPWGCGLSRREAIDGHPVTQENRLGNCLMAVRSYLRDAVDFGPACLFLGDSQIRNLHIPNFAKHCVPGGTTVQLGAVLNAIASPCLHKVVLFVGTNDCAASRWPTPASTLADGTPKPKNSGALKRNLYHILKTFFKKAPQAVLYLCDILPRLCDAPKVRIGNLRTSQIQRLAVELNRHHRNVARKLRPFRVIPVEFHAEMSHVQYFATNHRTGAPDLHLNGAGTIKLQGILDAKIV